MSENENEKRPCAHGWWFKKPDGSMVSDERGPVYQPYTAEDVPKLRRRMIEHEAKRLAIQARIDELEPLVDELQKAREAYYQHTQGMHWKSWLGQALVAAELAREVPKVIAHAGLQSLLRADCPHTERFDVSGACKRCGAT